jgi:hypothetical protein
VNLAWTVVIVMAIGWTLVSVLVALAFGGMARGREASPDDLADLTDLSDRAAIKSATPPLRDDEYRTAV